MTVHRLRAGEAPFLSDANRDRQIWQEGRRNLLRIETRELPVREKNGVGFESSCLVQGEREPHELIREADDLGLRFNVEDVIERVGLHALGWSRTGTPPML